MRMRTSLLCLQPHHWRLSYRTPPTIVQMLETEVPQPRVTWLPLHRLLTSKLLRPISLTLSCHLISFSSF
ncbi:BnaA08g07130D [Brassica napus]|uniref:BnaA08g07130D protein n=1 Tax=Brassica napus TaxID=3708 RepID=A0A078HYE4_BRANA|nr:BnaA08g07130D [Brassica napus]